MSVSGNVRMYIINERFGPVVEKVARFINEYGPVPLLYIKNGTELPLFKVKESLRILIKYCLVTFVANQNENVANYSLNPERVLLMLRYPLYINLIKNKFGGECEMFVEELLHRSFWTASETIITVFERIMSENEQVVTMAQVRDNFLQLITAKYLIRMPHPEADKPVPNMAILESEKFQLPELDIRIINDVHNKTQPASALPDSEIFWTVNFDRFHQDMRDKVLVTAFIRKFDENVGEFVRLLLQQMYLRTQPWAEVSGPIPIAEIRDLAKKQNTHHHLVAFFDQYVTILELDTSGIIQKAGDASGGSLEIHLKKAFTQFAWEIIEHVVLEKFDTKAARIFQLVKLKGLVELDQIQKMAMIPAKESKNLTYILVEANFLEVQELRKSTKQGPNKFFSMFYVHLDNIVRMILEQCQKTLFNIMSRKNHERLKHKRITDKKQRVDTIIIGMKAENATPEQLKDIQEMISQPEKELLEKIESTMKKLNTVQLEIEETMFLLQMYLIYT